MKKIAFAALVLLALCAGGSFADGRFSGEGVIIAGPTEIPITIDDYLHTEGNGLKERVTKLELEIQGIVAWIYRVPEPIEISDSVPGFTTGIKITHTCEEE